MKDYQEAVAASFVDRDGYESFRFGDDDEYELALEPLLFGQVAVALYHRGELILEDKVPVRPAYRTQGDPPRRTG